MMKTKNNFGFQVVKISDFKIINLKSTVRNFLIVCCLISLSFPTSLSFAQDSNAVSIHIGYVQTEDSTKMLTAKVTNADGTPVQEVEVLFYVKRMFGLLPVEGSFGNIPTDENGETSIDLPKKDYQGDAEGNLIIIAKIEDDDNYDNVETQSTMKIGTPLINEADFFARSLWAPTAPWGLILTFIILIGGVWCTYCFVGFLVYKIKKAGE